MILRGFFDIQKENKKRNIRKRIRKRKEEENFENKMHKRNHIFYWFDRACTWNCIKYKNIVRSITDYIWHLNLGAITFVFYCFCVLIEVILKGKEFKLYELLQIPMSLVTSVFINIFDRYLNIVPDTLGQKLLVLFFAIVVTGIGAATMVNMKLVPNPADALAATIGDKLGKGMGIGKNVFDVTCFCTSGIIGLVFTRHIIGLGIGTVLAVIFTGRVIAVYNYFLKHPMQNLAGITAEL